MNEVVWKFIFERSRNQYDSATRWSAIVILALIAFHLLIFSPYLEVDKKLKEAEKQSYL